MAPGRLSITQVSPQGGRQQTQKRDKSPPTPRGNSNEEYMCYMQDDCTFKSKSIDGVGDHVKKEHLNLKEGLGCVFEGCNFRGTAMPEMKSHYSSVHESKESREAERTTCLLCGARRRTEGEVMRHIRIVHLKDNEYLCNACEKGKYATFSLKEWCNHVAQNHAADPPKIEFRRQEGFDPSKRLPMTAQPVQEEVVDLTDGPEDPKAKGTTSKAKSTTTPARGKSTLALTGTEDKPSVQFKCTHCPDKFASKDVLLKHVEKDHDGKGVDEIKSATGESLVHVFLCMLCDKKTQSDEDIKKHVIATHFKTFQAICPHCPHVASSPADLQSHGQTEHYKHFSLSKLLCSKCDYTSKNVEVMQTHTSKAHGVEGKKSDGSDKKDAEPKKEEKGDELKKEELKSETSTASEDTKKEENTKDDAKSDTKADEKSESSDIKDELPLESKTEEKDNVSKTDSKAATKNDEANKEAATSKKTEEKDGESANKSGEANDKSATMDMDLPLETPTDEDSKEKKAECEKKTNDKAKEEQVAKSSTEKISEKSDVDKKKEESSNKKDDAKEKETKKTEEEKTKADTDKTGKDGKNEKDNKSEGKNETKSKADTKAVEKEIDEEDVPLRRSARSSGSSSSNENSKNDKKKESEKGKDSKKVADETPVPKKIRLSEPSKGLSKSGNNFDAPLDLF